MASVISDSTEGNLSERILMKKTMFFLEVHDLFLLRYLSMAPFTLAVN